jgi:hypothetical protein
LLKRANYLIENTLHRARPALAKAIEACRAFNTKLVIVTLDRLSRDRTSCSAWRRAASSSWPWTDRTPIATEGSK